MKVLVTGNKGYIGSVLTEILRQRSYEVIGYDTDYFAECELARNFIDVCSFQDSKFKKTNVEILTTTYGFSKEKVNSN